MLLVFIVLELLIHLAGNPFVLREVCKFVLGCSSVLLAVSGLRHAAGEAPTCSYILAVALALCAVADMAISANTSLGIFIFMVAHLALCAALITGRRPRAWQAALAVALQAACLAVVFTSFGTVSGLLLPLIAYAMVLCLVISLAAGNKGVLRFGTLVFVISDVLTGAVNVFGRDPVLDMVALGLYYLAMWLLALAVYRAGCSV